MTKINRESPIPAYYQIALDMRQRIERQEWVCGQQIPPEPNLAELYQVSRVTLRQALSELVKGGFLVRQRGNGTFVSQRPPPIIYDLGFPISFTDRIKQLGYQPSSQVLEAEVLLDPLPEVVRQLRVQSREAVAYLKRVLTIDAQPVAIDRSWFADRLCPEITRQELIDHSVSETLSRRYHLVPVRSETLFEMIRATPEDAELLDVFPEAALIQLTTISYLERDIPLEYSSTTWLGDRVRFHFAFPSVRK